MKQNLKYLLAAVLLLAAGGLASKALTKQSATEAIIIEGPAGQASAQANPYLYDQTPLGDNEYSSLVRLEMPMENGKSRFFCSGVVISKNLVLTAAHCVMEGGMFEQPTMREDPILVKSEYQKGKKQAVAKAVAYAANGRGDYAVITGDFSKFNVARITTSPTFMYSLSTQLVACGFPWGSKTHVCYPLEKRKDGKLMKSFALGFNGYLYPGMSGGPVVDRVSGLVFAVNSAVDPDRDELVLVPIIGLNEMIEERRGK